MTTNRRDSRRFALRRSAFFAASIASPRILHHKTARHTRASSTCGLRFILLRNRGDVKQEGCKAGEGGGER